MGRKLDEPTIGVTIRLTERVIDATEGYRKRMCQRTPGLNISTSDAVRILLMRGLAEIEGDDE